MFTITKAVEGTHLTITLSGRLDTQTSPNLDAEVKNLAADITDLTFDMADLEYIASSGLRVLLVAAKKMADRGGTCIMINVPSLIMETFDMTGLSSVFTIA